MAAGRFVVPPYFPARNRNDTLLGGALLYVYQNLTTVLTPVYADEGLTTPLVNPVVANASGSFPAIWAEAGTEADPVLYSLSVTTATGEAPGNPFTFDNYRPSVDFETATLALAEAAADEADTARDQAVVAADLALDAYNDILALAASAPDTDPIVIAGKANVTGSNILGANQAAFRTAIGADLAANVNFLQSGTAAALRSIQSKLRDIKYITDFAGCTPIASKNNAVNHTAAINAALADCANCEVRFPKGVYMVQAGSADASHSGSTNTVITGAIQINNVNGLKLTFEPGAILQCIDTAEPNGSAIWVFQSNNIIIEGGQVIGDKTTHLGVGGQGLSGLMNYGSNNVFVKDTVFSNWWGDGLNVQGDGNNVAAQNMHLINVVCDANGRNGLSVIHVDGFTAVDSVFKNTVRQDPQAGVDVEPNPGQYAKNCVFVNCQFFGNFNYGFISGPQSRLVPTPLRGVVEGLALIGCVAHDNPLNFNIEADSQSYMLAPSMVDCVAYNGTGAADFRIRNTKYGSFIRCQSRSTATTNGFLVRGEYAAQRLIGSASTGTFTFGETVTGGTSGATGIVMTWNAVARQLEIRAVTGTFTTTEVVTGGTSAATLTLVNGSVNEPPSFANMFSHCTVMGGLTGFLVDANTIRNTFADCQGIANSQHGIRILTAENIIQGGTWSYNMSTGIQLGVGSDRTSVIGNYLGGNVTNLQVSGGVESVIALNTVRSLNIASTGILVTSTTGYHRLIHNDYFGGGRFSDATLTDVTTVRMGNVSVQNNPHSESGAGAPEGAVTAPIGSLWQRRDGGNSTSVAIKETGTGNTGWRYIAGYISGSATYDPASLVDGAGVTTTVTVTGAVVGDIARASFSNDLQGILLTAWVSAADTVSVRFQNETTGTIDLASGTLRARVEKV